MVQKRFVLLVTTLVLVLSYFRTINASYSTGICTFQVPTNSLVGPYAGPKNGPRYTIGQRCCQGWRQKPNRYRLECEPECAGGCENGNCTAPNVCVCRHGYVKDNSQRCTPTCPYGCSHGTCYQGRCHCYTGYTPDSVNQRYCVPHCVGGCGEGGECVSPNVCRCKPGYIQGRNGKCMYHCGGGCPEGAYCAGPNRCQCTPGYKLIQNKCEPSCPRGCSYGKCTAPNTCTCSPGWVLNRYGDRCEQRNSPPRCSQPCLNGDCTGYETCTCKKGYVVDPRNRFRCVAHCPGGCTNGVCSAPNFCICNAGYVKDPNNRCISKTDAVSNGILNMLNKGK